MKRTPTTRTIDQKQCGIAVRGLRLRVGMPAAELARQLKISKQRLNLLEKAHQCAWTEELYQEAIALISFYDTSHNLRKG